MFEHHRRGVCVRKNTACFTGFVCAAEQVQRSGDAFHLVRFKCSLGRFTSTWGACWEEVRTRPRTHRSKCTRTLTQRTEQSKFSSDRWANCAWWGRHRYCGWSSMIGWGKIWMTEAATNHVRGRIWHFLCLERCASDNTDRRKRRRRRKYTTLSLFKWLWHPHNYRNVNEDMTLVTSNAATALIMMMITTTTITIIIIIIIILEILRS